MLYVIEHETRLAFPKPVREHLCELRIAPRTNGQKVLDLEVKTDPGAELVSYVDAFGNTVYWFSIVEPHDTLATTMRARVETSLANPFEYETIDPARERAWIDEALWREPRLWDFVFHRSATTPDLGRIRFGEPFPQPLEGKSVLAGVQAALEWIEKHIRYETGSTEVHAPLAEVLEARAGVCQDFAHLLVAIVRTWGVPARYAVGYVDPESTEDGKEDGGKEDGGKEDGKETAAEATHAWAEVLIPGAGWRGFDVTNGLVVNDTYVTVAVGRDSADAAPQRGSFKGEDPGRAPEVCVRVNREA
jgi:transglutaminase-like putative cysteine protease